MTHYPWRAYKRENPLGDKARSDHEEMMRQGSQSLLIRVSRLQAEREGPDAVQLWRELRGVA